MKQIVNGEGKLVDCDKEIRIRISDDGGETWDRQFVSLKMQVGADLQEAMDQLKKNYEEDKEEPMVYGKDFKFEVEDL